MQESKTYWIKILYDPDKKHERFEHRVLPGHQYLRPGDQVIFMTKYTDAVIWIPNAQELFSEKNHLIIPLSEDGESEPLTVNMDCPVGSVFPYAVYCGNGNGFAEGNTPPKMIIE